MVSLRDELLTVREAAAALRVTPHTIYRWIAEGRLPAVRYSRKVIRVRRDDLAALSPASGHFIRELRVAYEARPSPLEAEYERERRRVRRLLGKYEALASRPRSPDDPPRGSREALLRHVGTMSHEDAEELRRVVREAKTYSPDPEL